MSASLEEMGLPPRPNITITTVDRETVRSILKAERTLLDHAIKQGIDADEAHRDFGPYLEGILSRLSADDRAEFERLFVEEALDDQDLVKAQAGAAAAEQRYEKLLEEIKPPSTGRVFMAGVNVTILIGLALFWAFR